MLPFFKVRPPLSTGQRVNLELLMRQTIETIGADLPRQSEVVADLSELDIDTSTPTRLFESIVGRFPPSGQDVDLLVLETTEKGLPSFYRCATESTLAKIEIHDQTLGDPLRTIVELSNQYANHFWKTCDRIDPDQIHANLTQLLPICCGLGTLVGEASFYDLQWSQAGWQGWSMSRSGYYNASEVGYASALLARHRGERNPGWFKSMRLDSSDTAKRAARYFDDCDRRNHPLLFDGVSIPNTHASPTELASWLGGEDESFALAAGYALVKTEDPSRLVVESAILAAGGSNTDLVTIAIEILGRSRSSTNKVQSLVGNLVASRNHQVSIASLLAAASLGMPIAIYRKRIAHLLDVYAEGSDQLIELVANEGIEFESFDKVVCQHLAEAVRYSNDEAVKRLVACLREISGDPRMAIEKQIKEAELRERALAELS